MNRPVLVIASLVFGLLFQTCDDRELRIKQEQALLESRLLERLDMGRRLRIEECDRKLLDSAIYLVDSIRVLEAKWALDTVDRPHKPYKPEHPGPPGVSLDTLEVKPLLPDSVRQ